MKQAPKTKLLLAALAIGMCLGAGHASAQDKKKTGKEKKSETTASAPVSDTYLKLPSGIDYKIARHGTGKVHPKISDYLEINLSYSIGDTVLFDSRKMNNDKPVPFVLSKPRESGDPVEVFPFMVAGDSAVIRYPLDSLKKSGRYQPWMDNRGNHLVYNVSLVSCTTEQEMAVLAEKQKGVDDKILQEYFAKNSIKATKTASGLYYTIATEGRGENIKAGQTVNVNYTGMFMDGKKFDSNVDTAFHHVQPFMLEVARGKVIKGWDEGLQLLKLGSKATFYIPSTLAYGGMERNGIPANSILIFHIEIPDQAGEDDKLLQEYFAKNNIKATKTASGLYYTVSKEGKGEKIKEGQNINVDYTGMFMDGKKFDSNTDTAFHHVQPFQLEVGKGRVIKGWDEGLQLLKIGSKAKFYIPSGLAYGSADRKGIPPNSILIFDVEVSEAPDQMAIDDKLLQEYFAKNKIQAQKTPTGLYYVITTKGLGPNAKPGKNVTMNYTGKTLDGKTFDSNMDPAFNHVQPFTFPLGQGRVIKGWDEGVQLLNMGSKATFYIPSMLGYGAAGAGGQIPPNAILVFDVEVTGIDK